MFFLYVCVGYKTFSGKFISLKLNFFFPKRNNLFVLVSLRAIATEPFDPVIYSQKWQETEMHSVICATEIDSADPE
ncbi:Protein of unknown function [Gryllus bimaculatus]|nr:Protein of unknown function [Gryllus bimaculatus]